LRKSCDLPADRAAGIDLDHSTRCGGVQKVASEVGDVGCLQAAVGAEEACAHRIWADRDLVGWVGNGQFALFAWAARLR
jgi:hypothetical protein